MGDLIDKIKPMLIANEACVLRPYKCTANKLTIGVGRNLEDKGISNDEAMYMLDNDIKEVLDDLRSVVPFDVMPQDAQLALVDLRFQVGSLGFRRFVNMRRALDRGDYAEAAKEMADSAVHRNKATHSRSQRRVDLLAGCG